MGQRRTIFAKRSAAVSRNAKQQQCDLLKNYTMNISATSRDRGCHFSRNTSISLG